MEQFVYQGKPKTILRELCERFPQLSYNSVNKVLRNKDVKVNGKRVDSAFVLSDGDSVVAYFAGGIKYYKTIYEDDNIIIVDKNLGLEVEGEFSLVSLLKKDNKNVRAVHRIDRNTRGLVVLALNDLAEKALLNAFKRHSVAKYYAARIKGVLQNKCATLTAYLAKNAKKSEVKIFDSPQKGARKIVTEYRVLNEGVDESWLEIRLITGATHQIRAHLAFVGFPVLGDNKYGDVEFNKSKGLRFQELYARRLVFSFNEGVLQYLDGREFKTDY